LQNAEETGFSRILTLLRKESGLSQKEAAQQLGVSQALLSHYEHGTRECRLPFLVKVASFYGVSCDFLLGVSPERTGSTLYVENIPENENITDSKYKGSVLPALNKRLIINSLNIIFELLQLFEDKSLTTEVSHYLMITVYKVFRIIFSANPTNSQQVFSVPEMVYMRYSDAEIAYIESRIEILLRDKNDDNITRSIDKLKMSTIQLSSDYPLYATSLMNLIQLAEKVITHK
jgi:transcriptional regulator with XRE-family HTH domain